MKSTTLSLTPTFPFPHRLVGVAVIASLSLLAGCQTVRTPSQPAITQAPQSQDFNISGKIGVRTPQQSGSAFYRWVQQGERFSINLSGALGIGQTTIQGRPGQVTLDSARTGTLQAATPEELLLKATGWRAPITHVRDWVNGRASAAQASTQRDETGRLTRIQEDGWSAQLSYAGTGASLPERLVITDDSGQNRIILTIQNRQ